MQTRLLEALPSLARRLTPRQTAEVADQLVVSTVDLRPGRWDAPLENRSGHLGFLVLEGLLVREVCISRDWSSELLGQGDLLRPWLEDSASFVKARLEVLARTRLAVLDRRVAKQIGLFPPLVEELIDRAVRRSRSMAVHAVIEGVHRIDERLLILFWHMAEQHGHRENGRVTVPIRLTHEQLARLVGARRPTVTTALGALEADGRVVRVPDGGWIVSGDPPGAGANR